MTSYQARPVCTKKGVKFKFYLKNEEKKSVAGMLLMTHYWWPNPNLRGEIQFFSEMKHLMG